MSASTATIATAVIGSVDSHARALTKAISWRAVGTADTFLWGWLITGHPGHAGAIASLEVLTKIVLYYVHERAWRLIPWAPNARLRSFMKAVSWRVIGSIDTFTLSFIITGSGKSASLIAIAEVVTKIGLYYVHERLWRKVAWGRLDPKPAAAA
jgi:uncharacterized membrane protein